MERLKDGFLLRVYHSQPRVGGAFRFGFRSFAPSSRVSRKSSDNRFSRYRSNLYRHTGGNISRPASPQPKLRVRYLSSNFQLFS